MSLAGSVGSLCGVAWFGVEGSGGPAVGNPSRQDAMKALKDSLSRGCPSAGCAWPAAAAGSSGLDASVFAASFAWGEQSVRASSGGVPSVALGLRCPAKVVGATVVFLTRSPRIGARGRWQLALPLVCKFSVLVGPPLPPHGLHVHRLPAGGFFCTAHPRVTPGVLGATPAGSWPAENGVRLAVSAAGGETAGDAWASKSAASTAASSTSSVLCGATIFTGPAYCGRPCLLWSSRPSSSVVPAAGLAVGSLHRGLASGLGGAPGPYLAGVSASARGLPGAVGM